ncbi:unnamed protein product [Anisakis simplex]|uniref:ZP domain-containing protein n=1 Tax=Anisakis simplex TaxID=6269 RepID=A0A0M3KES9_ANISI|nr:unnamed protein product [Anisakis simplex]
MIAGSGTFRLIIYPLLTIWIQILQISTASLDYPNEVIGKPLVECEFDRMVVKSNQNDMIYNACITVQLHPLFVTANDRSYCVQCVFTNSESIENVDETLAISQATPAHLTPHLDSHLAKKPKCSYAIRRDSLDGPKVHYATVGQTVFHVWECDGTDGVRMRVQNCYVEDGQENRILIIDENGYLSLPIFLCGIDQYILPTPQYSRDLRIASQVSFYNFITV